MTDGITGIGSSNTATQMRMVLSKKLDASGDGVIDKTEIRAALEAGKGASTVGHKGASLSYPASSPANYQIPAHDAKEAAGSASDQPTGVSHVLKNYLAQCGQAAQQQTIQGFATVV